MQLVIEPARSGNFRGKRLQPFRRDAAPLEFPQQQAELRREAGEAGAGPEDFQFGMMPCEQGAQHHHTALFTQKFRRGQLQPLKNKFRQPLEGKDVQSGIALEPRVCQQLPLDLERGLFGREKNQRRAAGIIQQF